MTWLAIFFGAAILVALTPGANNLLGMHNGMRSGFVRALGGLAGRLGAFVLLIAAVAAGLGQLLAASEVALTVIKWIGVAYLLWLGARLIHSTFRDGTTPPAGNGLPDGAGPRSLVRREFLVAISNPKAILVFTAFVPQFVDTEHGPLAWQVTLLGGVYLLAELVAGTVYISLGALAGATRMSVQARRNVDRGTGAALLGLAGALAASNG